MKQTVFVTLLLYSLQLIYCDDWQLAEFGSYQRITNTIIRDINNDGLDEIIIASFSNSGKKVDVYSMKDKSLILTDSFKVPFATIFFDAGDIDNDSQCDMVFLSSNGLYYRTISFTGFKSDTYSHKPGIKSEIVVPQPEILSDVCMISDLDGDGQNELIIENVRAIEIYETKTLSKISSINLETFLEFSMIPGQFYPHYIFYTLPIIHITDLDGDGKKEIITKFPKTMNIFARNSKGKWVLNNIIQISKDNIYFLSNSFIKFSFPIIDDINQDSIKEIIISTANLDMPKIQFEAVGDIYYLDKGTFSIQSNEKIVIKGIPLSLPYFFYINESDSKELICPVIPFNLISIFGILNGSGDIRVPFYSYKQTNGVFHKTPKKLFTISFKIENVTSLVEEIPFDQYEKGVYPDFYYFTPNEKKKIAEIEYYSYSKEKRDYATQTIQTINLENYTSELPASLKIAYLSGNRKKDVVFILHDRFYIITRK